MTTLQEMRQSLSEATKDMRLNWSSVIGNEALKPVESWTVAYASALFIEDRDLAQAIGNEAGDLINDAHVDDAKAAVSIMAMNTVFYRFRHMVGKPSYGQMRAGLRMNRMTRPATTRKMFELISLACAALAGCEVCIQSHEASLLKAGANENQVHAAVRIAAVVKGFSIANFVER
jgi:lipoyl-dependent peroxiredoxin subunit D